MFWALIPSRTPINDTWWLKKSFLLLSDLESLLQRKAFLEYWLLSTFHLILRSVLPILLFKKKNKCPECPRRNVPERESFRGPVPLKDYNRKIRTLWTFCGLGTEKRLNQRSQHCSRLSPGRGCWPGPVRSLSGQWEGTRLRFLRLRFCIHVLTSTSSRRDKKWNLQNFWQWGGGDWQPSSSGTTPSFNDDVIVLLLLTELLLLSQNLHCVLALCVTHCCKHFKYTFVLQSLSHTWLFVTPWTVAHQVFLSFIIPWGLLKLISIESALPSNHLILCHPFLLLPSIFPIIKVFSNVVSSSHQVAKVLQLQLQQESFLWTIQDWFPLGLTGLISLLS